MAGGKVLDGIPLSFSSEHIMIYFERINKTFAPVSTLVKKNFSGSQFLEEIYLDVSSTYIKQSEDLYVGKDLCAASLIKVDLGHILP